MKKTTKSVCDDGLSNHGAIGSNWQDVRKKIFTEDEILKSDKRVSLLIKQKKRQMTKKTRTIL